MKKIFLLLCILLTSVSVSAGNKTGLTSIEGHFTFEYKAAEVKLMYVVDGKMETYATSKIDPDGKFGFLLSANPPGFYYLDYGQMKGRRDQLLRFYLQPNLDLSLEISEKEYVLKGKKTGHNKLVQKANKVYDAFARFNTLGGMMTYEQFYPFLEKEGVKMVQDLKNSIRTGDEKFDALMKLAVQCDYENEMYGFFRLPRIKHPEKGNRPEVYNELHVDGVKFSDENILRLGNGYNWMESYFFNEQMQNGFRSGPSGGISNSVSHIGNDRLIEVYIMNQLSRIKLQPDEYKTLMAPLYKYFTSEKSKEFLVQYEKELHKNVGQPGLEFTYNDVNDKPVSFNDFRGKYVYIDVWATWCGPCKKEIPFLKELEHEYREKDIVFMSVSVDELKDKQKWKDFVKNENLKGVQLMADKAFKSAIAKNYEINAIPRFLLFDKEGKIISIDAYRPSNPKLRNQLNRLLGNSR